MFNFSLSSKDRKRRSFSFEKLKNQNNFNGFENTNKDSTQINPNIKVDSPKNENPLKTKKRKIVTTTSTDNSSEDKDYYDFENEINFYEDMMENFSSQNTNPVKEKKQRKEEEFDLTQFQIGDTESIIERIMRYEKTIRAIPNFKMDFILDLDQTLIFSKNNQYKREGNLQKEIYNLCLNNGYKNEFNFQIQLRKGLSSFFSELNEFCTFYINTLSHPNYAKLIIKKLKEITELNISENNVITSANRTNGKNKNAAFILNQEQYLIFDDSIRSWDEKYFDNVIPSMKFQGFTEGLKKESIFSKVYQYYFSTNKLFEYDDFKRNLYDEKNILYCMETESSEFSQLKYISQIIKKIYLLSYILKISMKDAFHLAKKYTLKGLRIFLNFKEDNLFYTEMVENLGGEITEDYSISTHIIGLAKESEIYDFKKEESSISNKKIVNVKWLIHSFFSIYRMNEEENIYKYLC